MAATRKAFSTRMIKASFAEVQKLVLLIAVAVYAFCKKEMEDLLMGWSGISDMEGEGEGEKYGFWLSHVSHYVNERRFPWELLNQQYVPADRSLQIVEN